MTNKTRYIPKGYTEYKTDLGDYPKDMFAAYVQKFEKHVAAIFYTGKQSNATWHYRFATMEDAGKKINETISRLMTHADFKAKRAEARKAPTTLKPGDILDSSWGYDQTNVDFYMVTAVKGTRTVDLRKIGSKVVSNDGGGSTHVVAEPRFIDDKILTKRVSNGYVRLNTYAIASLWNGKPMYETASGWGH